MTYAPRLATHIPSLDGMRALSIGLVILAHAAATRGAPHWLDRPFITSLGNVGVRVFFVISGFLITTLLLRDVDRHGEVRLKVFYVRRALRILPAALLYIGTMWALHLAGVIDLNFQVPSRQFADSAMSHLLHAITFTANYDLDYNWYYNHLWTLSVEEQFYLLWPFTLCFLGLRRGLAIGCAILVIAPVIRMAMFAFGNVPEIALSRHFEAVADALATGCVAALLHNRLTDVAWFQRLVGWPAIPLGALLVGVGYGTAIVWRPGAYMFGQTAANLGVLLVIQHVVRHPEAWASRLLNLKPLQAIGVLSYSLYLWQEPFLYFLSSSWPTSFPQNLLLAVIAALASYFLVEKPVLRLKDRLTGGNSRHGA